MVVLRAPPTGTGPEGLRLPVEQNRSSRTPGRARSPQRTSSCASLCSVGWLGSERDGHGLSTASTLLRAATLPAVMPRDIFRASRHGHWTDAPREPAIRPAPRPSRCAEPLRRGTRRECLRWLFVPLLAAARRLQPLPGCGSRAHKVAPARPRRMVTSTPCSSSPRQKTGNRLPSPHEGGFPNKAGMVESARLRGLAPSTSPLRRYSVKSPRRALLPWVSFSRSPLASRSIEPSQARQHPAPPSCSRPRRADQTKTKRLSGERP